MVNEIISYGNLGNEGFALTSKLTLPYYQTDRLIWNSPHNLMNGKNEC